MTTLQYSMLIKQLTTLHLCTFGEYTFTITNRLKNVFELKQLYKGISVSLYIGTEAECIDAARECIRMIGGIN